MPERPTVERIRGELACIEREVASIDALTTSVLEHVTRVRVLLREGEGTLHESAVTKDLAGLALRLRVGLRFTYTKPDAAEGPTRRLILPMVVDERGVGGVDTFSDYGFRRFLFDRMSAVELARWDPEEI